MEVKPAHGAAMYETLAQIYDITGQSRFSLKMVGYLLELMAMRRIKAKRVADLACGTGSAAVAMARRGFEVTGVDGSPAMLERARARADRWKARVEWRQQLLTELDLPGGYEIATCFYDSLNHLTVPLDLRKTFFAVRRALAPGGYFFFDMNTPFAYSKVWRAAEDSHLAERYARFWRATYDDGTGLATLQATYFMEEAGGLYRRLEVIHHARGYSPEEVRIALEEAGFRLLDHYNCLTFDPVASDTYRVAYLAQA